MPSVVEVRRATAADLPAFIEMGRALHDESPRYAGMHYDEDKVRETAAMLEGTLLAETGCMFLATLGGRPIGMTVGIISERFFSRDRFVSDLTMYIRPEHRGGRAFLLLMRALETWTRAQGIDDIAMGVSTEIHAESTVHTYRRLGYTLTGYTMTKKLG